MGRIRNTLRSFALIWQRFMLNSIGGGISAHTGSGRTSIGDMETESLLGR